MNISLWIQHHAIFTPTKTALRFEGRTITYADFEKQIEAMSQMLRRQLNIEQGDRIAILADNCPEYLVLLFACARNGAMLVPLNWRLAIPEHLYILQNAAVKALLLEESYGDRVAPVHNGLSECRIVGLDFTPPNGNELQSLLSAGVSVQAVADCPTEPATKDISLDTPLLIVYTSGTTGHPKGAVLTQGALQWNAINSIHQHDMTSQDHILAPLPFFHVGGLNNQTTPALHCGATVTIHRRFHPDEMLRTISDESPTITCLVPATMQACIASALWLLGQQLYRKPFRMPFDSVVSACLRCMGRLKPARLPSISDPIQISANKAQRGYRHCIVK